MQQKTKIGIVGCGNISGAYLKLAKTFDILETVACADVIPELAQAKAAEYGVPALRDRGEPDGAGCARQPCVAGA